jgi:hypothetical protein
MHKQVTVLATAALALAGAAALGAGTPAGAAAHRAPAPRPAGARVDGSTVDGLKVYVGYAEDKETNTPPKGAFPKPWQGSSGIKFLGNPVPGGQKACGGLKQCWDAGAIMVKNTTTHKVTVTKVKVNDHGSIKGGKVFDNLWGSFTVQPGKRVILTENPSFTNPGYDNFDTSGYPSVCQNHRIKVAPWVKFSIGGKNTKLIDSTHVLDTGGIDPGSCSPKRNESVPWRLIGTGKRPFGPNVGSTATCPGPWTCVDIGNPTPPGSQHFDRSNGKWTIKAGGTDITGLADHFRFVYQKLRGNGSVIAHVLSQTATSPGAKAGVMLRASKAPGSPEYSLLVSPGEGIKVQVRKILNGDTQKSANPKGAAPVWLKISRSGNTYSAYTSSNGHSWKLIPKSAITVNLGGTMRAGLAVTSHHAGVLGTAKIDGVKVG